MNGNDPVLSAIRIARDIAEGGVSADEILDQVERALAEGEPAVRAFTAQDVAAARAAARAAQGPLRGVPFAAKDNLDTASLPTAYGSALYEGHRPPEDAAAVRQAKAAGALLIGKTALAEFALMEGPATRNPHDLSRTPGGSSSGSAAAVAAGMVAFALGTQTGGSVIRPAAFCGVAGYKPSFGRLPIAGVKPVAPSLDTVGLFAATVADLAFVAAGLTGDAELAVGTTPPPRIGVCTGWAGLQASDAMVDAVHRAAAAAERAGASVTPLDLPQSVADGQAAHTVIMKAEARRALDLEYTRYRAFLSDRLKALLDDGDRIVPEDLRSAEETAGAARTAVSAVFDQVDVILAPGAPGPAPLGVSDTGSSAFNRLWTLLHLPSVNVPGLSTETGLPLGVQIIGPPGADTVTLAAADFVERAIAATR